MQQRPVANLRDFVLSMLVWVVGTLTAGRMVDAASPTLRVMAVVLAVVSALPWAVLVAGGIRQADEFSRQVHFLALAIAFAGVAFSVTLVDWLQRAEFVAPLRPGGLGLLAVWLWWGVGLVAASRYYR